MKETERLKRGSQSIKSDELHAPEPEHLGSEIARVLCHPTEWQKIREEGKKKGLPQNGGMLGLAGRGSGQPFPLTGR